MAVDTAPKRFSMLNFHDGTGIGVLPIPDGTIALGDRQHFLDCYSGIAFGPAVPVADAYVLATPRVRPTVTAVPLALRTVTAVPKINGRG